ncbi:AAA family ATPase, partial [Streptomyces anulatus]|uniref:AAA family ATPase n=1 Tax=Streptomyces anulatus TaxID=1892 RepID=UPI003430BE58
MLSLAAAAARDASIGQPLPEVWPSLTRAGVRIRRSQVTMICGQPNSGKSILALSLAAKMRVPTLFFSADTDEHTTKVRAVACLTGAPTATVDSNFGIPDAAAWYEEVLDDLVDVQFCFDSAPTLKDIDLELRAFAELHGTPGPHLMVFDNLMDITGDSDNE